MNNNCSRWIHPLTTDDGECTDRISYQVKQRAGDRGITAENMEKCYSIPISTKIRLMKALVWPVATYGCESWTLRENEETRPDAFEMKRPRKILWVSWTPKRTNKWVLGCSCREHITRKEGTVRHRQRKEATVTP